MSVILGLVILIAAVVAGAVGPTVGRLFRH